MLHENRSRTNSTDRSETMSLKKFSRAGFVALAGALLLGLALSVPTFHSSYAQAPAATNPPAATAPAPDAAAPAAPVFPFLLGPSPRGQQPPGQHPRRPGPPGPPPRPPRPQPMPDRQPAT